MHVYGLHKHMLERGHGSLVNIDRRNSVQQVLTRLDRDGYVTSAPPEGGRRILFAVTEAGRGLFLDWLRTEVARPFEEHPRFPVAVSLLGYLPPREASDLLSSRRADLAVTAEERVRELEEGGGLPRVLLLEVELKLALVRAELTWLDRVLEGLRDGTLIWDPDELRALAASLQGV